MVFEATYEMNTQDVDTSIFFPMMATGALNNPQIDEASGVAVSRQDSTLLWTHNDSGDTNRIFLLKNDGTYMGTLYLAGAENRDWEDIAIGPGPDTMKHYIYVADIGDNKARHPIKNIYRFPEPDITAAGTNESWVSTDVEKISFTYPDSIKMDAETILIDPWTKDIYILSKREFPVVVYRLPFPQSITDTMVAQKYGTLPFYRVTAGDISSDGQEIIIKTYEKVFLWTRVPGQSMADAFRQPPIRIPYTPEPQGEAIAWLPHGGGYYTLSESQNQVAPIIYFAKRK
jgi:hypothetical protein